MGFNTDIQWTDHSWNGWIGDVKVSEGCANCYMYRLEKRFGHNPVKVRRTSDAKFYEPLKWKDPAFVFTCSMSDFFVKDADEWRDDAWEVIRRTPHLTYQILTKRPERIKDHLPGDWGKDGYPNVWLGTSVELDKYRKRIEYLVEVPAAVHFLSLEPLLGPVHLHDGYNPRPGSWRSYLYHIEWVIVGGESGSHNRLMNTEWARSIRDQLKRTIDLKQKKAYLEEDKGIPFFFKQNGGHVKCKCHNAWGCRLLDGRTWDQMPEVEVVA